MRSHARSIHVSLCALILAFSVGSPVFATEETPAQGGAATATATAEATFTKPGPPPVEPGGVCAPWHRCIAWAGLGMAALLGLALAAGYFVQSKGFDELEHKQGNPEGVKAARH